MANKKTYRFGEKLEEYSFKTGKKIPVWQTPKYEQSRAKAIEVIETYENVKEGDFWILMNDNRKSDKMLYSGLIISHNACLKINSQLKPEDRFVPSCVSLDKSGYADSLVYTYSNDEQGIYEVGEVSSNNCKNPYPYAMAYKRLFDRVVLKNSRIAYDGIYSDSEAEEFRQPDSSENKDDPRAYICEEKQNEIAEMCLNEDVDIGVLLTLYGVDDISQVSNFQHNHMITNWEKVSAKAKEAEKAWTSQES